MYEQIKQVLVTSFHVQANEVTGETTLTELGLDSLDLVELAMAIEPFGVRVTDDELAGLQRIDAIVEFIERRRATVSG